MYYSYPQETFQEVPGEISLALSISGCPLRCKGCHSTETYNKSFGSKLTEKELLRLLTKHKHISCVLFYGGEWEIDTLKKYVTIIQSKGLKVALYSGFELDFFSKSFIETLDFLKVGVYKQELGGLSSEKTNQRFYRIINKEIVDSTKEFH